MIKKNFKGKGYNLAFNYTQMQNIRDKYLYKITSSWSGAIFYNVFKAKKNSNKYPEGLETIFAYDEALMKFKQL